MNQEQRRMLTTKFVEMLFRQVESNQTRSLVRSEVEDITMGLIESVEIRTKESILYTAEKYPLGIRPIQTVDMSEVHPKVQGHPPLELIEREHVQSFVNDVFNASASTRAHVERSIIKFCRAFSFAYGNRGISGSTRSHAEIAEAKSEYEARKHQDMEVGADPRPLGKFKKKGNPYA